MFATSAPPRITKGWALSNMLEAADGSPRSLASTLVRMEHPAERNASAAAATAVRIKWQVPSHVLTDVPVTICDGTPRSLVPARWSEATKTWTTAGVPEPSWMPATRSIQFLTTSFSPHALVLPLAADFPYASWSLEPAPSSSGVGSNFPATLFSIETARGFHVKIHVSADGCSLVSPDIPSLGWLTGSAADSAGGSASVGSRATPLGNAPVLPPGQLFALLDSVGLRLTPSDADVAGVNAILAAEAAAPPPPMAPAPKGASRAEKEALIAAYEESCAARAAAPVPVLPPLLSSGIEAALTQDIALSASAFTIRCVRARGYKARSPPPDPDDAPPNAGAAVLAEALFLESLSPEGVDIEGQHARAWLQDATATLRMRASEDPSARRGFVVKCAPEGVPLALGDQLALALPFASISESLLAHASPEARRTLHAAPPSFTEVLRRTLMLTRPLAFSA
jgi:hypothetical protein